MNPSSASVSAATPGKDGPVDLAVVDGCFGLAQNEPAK